MSASTSFHTTVEKEANALVITMVITNCNDRNTEDFNLNSISQLLEKFQCANVVVDLSSVSIISSGFLGLLLRLQKSLCREKRGQLILCCLTEHIKQVIDVTHLDKVFSIVDTQEEALSSLE